VGDCSKGIAVDITTPTPLHLIVHLALAARESSESHLDAYRIRGYPVDSVARFILYEPTLISTPSLLPDPKTRHHAIRFPLQVWT
jgi:hypothetical protein